MKLATKTKRNITLLIATFIVGVGTYHSVMINSASFMDDQDVRFAKRLDEMTGIVKIGRQVAHQGKWIKLPQNQMEIKKQPVVVLASRADKVIEAQEAVTGAAVPEELELQMTEAVSPKKYAKGLNPGQFSGLLQTKEGVIETLNINLPSDSISVNFAEMSGNVFEYDLEGERFSGMFYQVDNNSYMVNLTNGPLEGSRFKFSKAVQAEEYTAPEMNNEIADYGNNESEAQMNPDVIMQEQGETAQPNLEVTQGYNFSGPQL